MALSRGFTWRRVSGRVSRRIGLLVPHAVPEQMTLDVLRTLGAEHVDVDGGHDGRTEHDVIGDCGFAVHDHHSGNAHALTPSLVPFLERENPVVPCDDLRGHSSSVGDLFPEFFELVIGDQLERRIIAVGDEVTAFTLEELEHVIPDGQNDVAGAVRIGLLLELLVVTAPVPVVPVIVLHFFHTPYVWQGYCQLLQLARK